MKSFKTVLAWLFLINLTVAAFADETVRLTNGEWPPYLGQQLKHYGVASHIVTEAFALEGVKVEYGFFPWARSLASAKFGQWDGSVVWLRSPEREAAFYLSDAVTESAYMFFHLKSRKFEWNTIDDLKNLRIGATLSYDYGEAFQNAEKENKIKTDRVSTDEQNFAKLLVGRIDIFPMDREVGLSMIRKHFKPEDQEQFTFHQKAVRSDSLHLLLSKKVEKNKNLIILFNKGLKRLKESGKVDQFIADGRKGKYD